MFPGNSKVLLGFASDDPSYCCALAFVSALLPTAAKSRSRGSILLSGKQPRTREYWPKHMKVPASLSMWVEAYVVETLDVNAWHALQCSRVPKQELSYIYRWAMHGPVSGLGLAAFFADDQSMNSVITFAVGLLQTLHSFFCMGCEHAVLHLFASNLSTLSAVTPS